MINKNKLYFFASLMTFCFGKAVTFDVNVNVGAASISNIKSNINKKILKDEWLVADDANGTNAIALSTAELAPGDYWSKDGGKTWVAGNTPGETDEAAYREYVTSAAREYRSSGDLERYDINYRDGIRHQKGGFAAGLDVGMRYELTPCVKIGARAFFTATNLKQDLSYTVTPVDKNGNLATHTLDREREVQMLIGYASAKGNGTNLGATNYIDDGIVLKRAAANASFVGLGNEKTAANADATANVFYALNINREGYKALKELKQEANTYSLTLDGNMYGSDKGIVLTKTGVAKTDAAVSADDATKAIQALINNNNAAEALRNRNYSVKYSDVKMKLNDGAEQAIENGNFTTMAVNVKTARANIAADDIATGINLAAGVPANEAKAYYVGYDDAAAANGKVHKNDKLVLSEEKYNEIIKAFETMSEDLDQKIIDQTLKVKNVWGGMITLSWNATDCTVFTLGAGVGVPSVSKIDNLKKKVGFAGMFEVSTKIADSFSVGLRYQYNRINLKEKKNESVVNHLSKVHGNLHIFSANFSYSF